MEEASMSMMSALREVTPRLLARLKVDPTLTEAVVLADQGIDGDTSDIGVLLKAMPPMQGYMMRALLDAMTPQQRSRMEAMAAPAAAGLRCVAEDLQEATRHRR